MNKIVIPTGYMGSGSSAVTDLLSEVKGYASNNGNFEYVFLHCPNGVFDLEDKLLKGNNTLRSDEALHSFYKCMQELYSDKHYWVADYKHKIDLEFIEYCNEFIDSLINKKLSNCYWYYQEMPKGLMVFYNFFSKLFYMASFGRLKIKPALRYREMWIAYPSDSQFYSCVRVFLNKIFWKLGIENSNLILDQLLLPHNLYRMDNYFNENCRVIVVERDPRDVFLLNKYYWSKMNVPLPYPSEVEIFCEYYRKMRECEKRFESEKILRIRFEDLIYFYTETVYKIFNFLEIPERNHVGRLTKLVPEKSKLNTQLFNRDPFFVNEANYIEKNIPEYLYTFPSESVEELSVNEVIL